MIASPARGSRLPSSLLACAQAFLITPSARTIATGCLSQPMGKFMIDRCVCAPQYLSAGTSSGPKLSVSVRVSVMASASPGMDLPTSYLTGESSMLARRNSKTWAGGRLAQTVPRSTAETAEFALHLTEIGAFGL